jgi:hypothetical protein
MKLKEPYTFKLPKGETKLKLLLRFYGHYQEPNLKLAVDLKDF